MTSSLSQRQSGLPHAITAYAIWGLLPLYLMLLHQVPPFEFVGWRVVFTVPVCFIAIAVTRQGRALWTALTQPRTVGLLLVSAVLIGGNWLVYIAAVQGGHVLAASLGYYINPLVNVLAGTMFLGEKLTRRQWIAVALAAAGVSMLAWGARDMLGISLTLAFSFCAYGLVRKLTPVASLPGLTIESTCLLLPAIGIIAWHSTGPTGPALGKDIGTDLLIAASGVVTAVPLLLFATAAQRMDYSTLGFVQFMSPTIAFLLALFVFNEPLRPIQLACFVTIWVAIAIFTWDLISRRRSERRGEA
ncbi:MAG: EamA family transporter RarD [Novosphingobium sp.]